MQKCYNCGKEVDDNVLICPDCGALVKRYGSPEPAQEEQGATPFPQQFKRNYLQIRCTVTGSFPKRL